MATEINPEQAAEFLDLVPGVLVQEIETEQAIAIIDMEGDIKTQIHGEGKASDGSSIGTYSTKPAYVHVASAKNAFGSQIPTAKLKARGKPQAGKKKGATARKLLDETVPLQSQYFEDGYSGLRRLMGRQVDKVDLFLTGTTAGSIASGTRDNVSTIAFTNDAAAERAEGHEKKYGKSIYSASPEAIEDLHERLVAAGQRALDKILPG